MVRTSQFTHKPQLGVHFTGGNCNAKAKPPTRFYGEKNRQREEDGVSIIGKASIVSCQCLLSSIFMASMTFIFHDRYISLLL
jgi:hypothetical protein